jgi:uncharacterized protein
MDSTARYVVRRDEQSSRYVLSEDGHDVAFAEFESLDGVVVFPHTVVTSSRRGEGLGARLVQAALDDVRPRGQRVRPLCWYVAEFIDEHPEYRDLLE